LDIFEIAQKNYFQLVTIWSFVLCLIAQPSLAFDRTRVLKNIDGAKKPK